MKYPFGMSFMKFLFLFVNFIFFPIFQKIRFALGQVAPHGKLCFRQIQRFAVIHFLLLLNLVIKKISPVRKGTRLYLTRGTTLMTECFCHSFSAITCAAPSLLTVISAGCSKVIFTLSKNLSGLTPSPARCTIPTGYCLFHGNCRYDFLQRSNTAPVIALFYYF